MNVSGIYEVIGAREFRGHLKGARFEATLDTNAENRALARGDIRLIHRTTPQLQPGSYRLPLGWLNQQEEGSNE